MRELLKREIGEVIRRVSGKSVGRYFHDEIGKPLVGTMLSASGFEVVDLGVDQPAEKIIGKALEINANIIGLSALLTTTMTYMKTVIDGYEERGMKHIKFAVGGAPITVVTNWQAGVRK